MSIAENFLPLNSDTISKIENMLADTTLPLTVTHRLRCILLKNTGKSNKEISDIIGVNEHSVGNWLHSFRENGLSGILGTSGRWHAATQNEDTLAETNLPAQAVCFEKKSFDFNSTVQPCILNGINELSTQKLNLAECAGHRVGIKILAVVEDLDTNNMYPCCGIDLTSAILENKLDFSSKENFERTMDNLNKAILNSMNDLKNKVIPPVVEQISLNLVEHEEDLRKMEFYDPTGKIELLVPKNFKNVCGNQAKLISPSLYNIYIGAVKISTYRHGVNFVNSYIVGSNLLSVSMLHRYICNEGKKIEEAKSIFIEEILPQYGFDPKTGHVIDEDKLPYEITSPTIDPEYQMQNEDLLIEKIEDYNERVDEYNEKKNSKDKKIDIKESSKQIYNDLDHSVNISIDNVEVKSQEKYGQNDADSSNADKPIIIKDGDNQNICNKKNKYRYKVKEGKIIKKKIKHVLNRSVAHIRANEGEYILIAGDIKRLILLVLAFLLHKGLMENRYIVFFTDGQKSINNMIKEIFSFRKITIVVDWYHVRHKCYEFFTGALVGGEKNLSRNKDIRNEFYSILFSGNIDAAINYLTKIDEKIIKNKSKIDEIKNYLDRKREYIYSYALMKELNLQNSSNPVEKANDILVAKRCKRKGMSWVNKGLAGMTNLLFLDANGETESWQLEKRIYFKLKPLSKKTMVKVNKHKEYLESTAFCV